MLFKCDKNDTKNLRKGNEHFYGEKEGYKCVKQS